MKAYIVIDTAYGLFLFKNFAPVNLYMARRVITPSG